MLTYAIRFVDLEVQGEREERKEFECEILAQMNAIGDLLKPTCLIFGEHEVEYEVAGELVAVLAAHLSIQHLQLTLALIELGVVRLVVRGMKAETKETKG